MPRGIPRDASINRKIIHRLKITRGHLDKVIDMVERNEYCIDVVQQSLAVQMALKSIDKLVLKNHLETCVSDSIKTGNDGSYIDEIIKVFEKK